MNRFFLTLAVMLWAHVWCAAAPAPDGVRGTVRGGDGADAEPLVGAVVVWAGTSVAAVTDADGRFVIRRPAGAVRLVATYVGFVVDTLAVAPMEAEAHFALRPVAMAEVTVGARRAGSSLDRLSALTTINVTSAELTRAACCNLGESFETNASVDVGYQDATTGARAIRMLGLGGQYVQMMTENVPNLRGLASTFGLSYVPGPWMDGISVSKGVGTVVNGYEAITGQIDVEYKKPMGEGTASGNVFASSRQWRTGALFVHERAWNAGIGLTQYVDLWGRELTLTAEYYRTQFGRRLVPDFDSSARTLVFVADGSRSFSNTVQLEARWQPLRGLDLDVAWRLNDARQTTAGRLRSRAATRRCWPPPTPRLCTSGRPTSTCSSAAAGASPPPTAIPSPTDVPRASARSGCSTRS